MTIIENPPHPNDSTARSIRALFLTASFFARNDQEIFYACFQWPTEPIRCVVEEKVVENDYCEG